MIGAEEAAEFRKRIEECRMPDKVLKEVEKQLKRLEKMHPDTRRGARPCVPTWNGWWKFRGVTPPWTIWTSTPPRSVLNEDHYDLEKVKERILEYLAVRKLKEKLKGPDSCVLSAHPAWEKRRWGNPLPWPWVANSCA